MNPFNNILVEKNDKSFDNINNLYFYCFGREKKCYELDRNRLPEFKKSFYQYRNKKGLCVDLVRSLNHMVVFDIDFEGEVTNCKELLHDYISHICKFFHSIFSISHKEIYGLIIILKNIEKNNLHIYLPEFFISHDNYEVFCFNNASAFEYRGFKLDCKLRNFMLPGCYKNEVYKEYKTLFINGNNYIQVNSLDDKSSSFAKVKKTLLTTKYASYLTGKLNSFQNTYNLIFPLYDIDETRYNTFEIYYRNEIIDTNEMKKKCYALFGMQKSNVIDHKFKCIEKENKWNIQDYKDFKNKNSLYVYMKKIFHLTKNPITQSRTINDWFRDIKNLELHYNSKPENDILDFYINDIENHLASLSPKFNVPNPLELIFKDDRFTMILFYVLINKILSDDDDEKPEQIEMSGSDETSVIRDILNQCKKILNGDQLKFLSDHLVMNSLFHKENKIANVNQKLVSVIDAIIKRFENVLDYKYILAINRLKKFDLDVLKGAYGEFTDYTLQYIAFCVLYQTKLKQKRYANYMEKGVCNFVCRSAYEDFEFLLHEQNGKKNETNPVYLMTKLFVILNPIMVNVFQKTMIWNKFTWVEFSEKNLISTLETIYKDLEEVFEDRNFIKSAINTCKNHFLYTKNEITHQFQPDFNYWFLQGKSDMHVFDILTMTTSPSTPQHFCTQKNKAGIDFTKIPSNFSDLKNVYIKFALDADFIQIQRAIFAQTGTIDSKMGVNVDKALEFIYVIANFDPEIVRFLFWIIGYFMIGTNPSKLIIWLWGSNDNGKTVFINLLNEIFGSYRGIIDESTVSSQGSKTNHKSDIDSAVNKRIAHAEELQCNLNDACLKDLSGNGTITFRAIYENFKEAKPLFTLLFTINESPLCKKATDALIARFKVIKFRSIFKEEFKNKSFEWMVENGKYAPKTWNHFQCGVFDIFLIALSVLDYYMESNGHMRLEKYSQDEEWKNEFVKNMNIFQKFIIECDLQSLEGNRLYMSQVQTKIRAFCTKNKIQEYCVKLENSFKDTYKDLMEEETVTHDDDDDDDENSDEDNNSLQSKFVKKIMSVKKTRKRKTKEVWFRDLVFGEDTKNIVISS